MFRHLLLFELNYYKKQSIFWVGSLLALLVGILLTKNNLQAPYYANASYAILFAMIIVTTQSIFVTGFLGASSILRDQQHMFESFIYSSPIDKFTYLFVKLSGLILITLFIHIIAIVGMIVGLNFIPAEQTGPFNPVSYLFGFTFLWIPNIFLCGTLVFSAAMLSRKLIIIYLVTVIVFIFYMAGSMIGNSPIMAHSNALTQEGAGISGLLDPYGVIAFFEQTAYWSVQDKNVLLPELKGSFLYNRLLWVAISIALFTYTYTRFTFKLKRTVDKKTSAKEAAPVYKTVYTAKDVSNATDTFSAPAFISKLKIEYFTVVKGIPFIIIICLSVCFNLITLGEQIFRGPSGDMPYYPLTELILELLQDPISKLGVLLAIYYAVELYWNERSCKMHMLIDATPIRNSVFFLSKLTTLASICITLIAVSCLTAIVFQLSLAHFAIKPFLYLQLFYYAGLPLLLYGGFTLFLQRFAKNKSTGLFLGISILLLSKLISFTSFSSPLTRFAFQPPFIFSDMTQSLYHDEAFHWYSLYWVCFVGILSLLTVRYWKRGNLKASEPISSASKWLTACLLFGFIGSGSYIFIQLNKGELYFKKDRQNFAEIYEKKYSKYQSLLQPQFTHLDVDVHIFPEERRYHAKGTLKVENKSSEAIDTLMVSLLKINTMKYKIDIDRAALRVHNKTDQVLWFVMDQSLLPGDSTILHFSLDVERSAFQKLDGEHYVTKNGSYFELEDFLPYFGYISTYEIQNEVERRLRGLPKLQINHPKSKHVHSSEDWLSSDIRIRTSKNQTAISVGDLINQKRDNTFSYFQYVTMEKIPRQFAIISAEYKVVTEEYNGVSIALYHSPTHNKDNTYIFNALKESIDYFSEHIAPYKKQTYKVVELPYFSSQQSFGVAYPGMYLGVENRFFNLDTRTAEQNPILRGTSHEFSHQFWGFQISPDNLSGHKMLTEMLAKYSELVIQEKQYGAYSNNGSLTQAIELYLKRRSRSANIEQPLYTVGLEPHIYYGKGLQVMTALRARIGEQKINQALRTFLHTYPYPKKPNSLHLLDAFYNVADSADHSLITDLFKRVVTHEFKLDSANIMVKGNTYEISVNISALKFVLNPLTGEEEEEPISDIIELACYSGYPNIKNKNMTDVKRIHLSNEKTRIVFTTNKKPNYIVIDPNRLRIDPSFENNILQLQ